MRTFDKASLRAILADMDAAVAGVAEKHGVKISVGRATYEPHNATVKVELSTIGEEGEVHSREAMDYQKHASLFGLDPNSLGAKFAMQGELFAITGLKPRSPKFPVLARRNRDGQMMKFTADTVVRAINAEPRKAE